MAKLKDDPITASQLLSYVENCSDFAFELRVLKQLNDMQFTCEHSGSYDDPVTDKPREFDIRATRDLEGFFLRLAVECKNIGVNCPLLVSRIPRSESESFHEVVLSLNKSQLQIQSSGPLQAAFDRRAITIEVGGSRTPYKKDEFVGKSCDQVGLTTGDVLTGNDADVFAKWSQALSSAKDLAMRAMSDGVDAELASLSLILPVVVVPNHRLWVVDYSENGNRVNDPRMVDRCSYFVGRQMTWKHNLGLERYTFSHLEFVTPNGLVTLFGEMEDIHHRFRVGDAIAQAIENKIPLRAARKAGSGFPSFTFPDVAIDDDDDI